MPVDHLAVTGGVERVHGCQHARGFEQVGLALRILPIVDEEAGSQRKSELFIIAKVAQREVRKIHAPIQGDEERNHNSASSPFFVC
jgi:hypothetical protein